METMKRKCFGSTKLFKVSRMFIISCQRLEAKENRNKTRDNVLQTQSISGTSPYVTDASNICF